MKQKTIIVDLDGTLCNNEHRVYLAQEKRWNDFHVASSKDKPNDWCHLLVQSLSKNCDIVFITGRPEKFREETKNWLREHWFEDYTLYMKPDGDFRKDFDFKAEVYEKHLKGANILFAIDDRKDTAKMWRSKGVPCLHCADGEF